MTIEERIEALEKKIGIYESDIVYSGGNGFAADSVNPEGLEKFYTFLGISKSDPENKK